MIWGCRTPIRSSCGTPDNTVSNFLPTRSSPHRRRFTPQSSSFCSNFRASIRNAAGILSRLRMGMPRLRFSVLLATAASLIGAAGCGGGGGASEISFSDRFTNVVPDLGGVDFYVDDVLRISNQAFGDSSAYEKRKAKDPTEVVSVNDAGTGNVLDAIEIDRVNKKSAHVFSLGLANPGNQQPGLRLLALLINRTPPSGNNSRVIVVHGYIRAVGFPTPNVDI